MRLGSEGAIIPLSTVDPGQTLLEDQENPIFTAQKAMTGVLFVHFLRKIYYCLRNFCINSSSWSNYNSSFFSFLKDISLGIFKFDL